VSFDSRFVRPNNRSWPGAHWPLWAIEMSKRDFRSWMLVAALDPNQTHGEALNWPSP
jgi:hypothetical protein